MFTRIWNRLLGWKVTTKAEREAVARNTRWWRMEVRPERILPLVVFALLVLPFVIVGLVHVARGGWMPLELS